MSERRRTPRTRTSGLSARVRPGHRLLVVDISTGGALLEAARPLRPGADIEVQFERDDRRLRMAGTVVRCDVTALDPHHGPMYRAAIAFVEIFDWAREVPTRNGYGVPDSHGSQGRAEGGLHK